MTEDEFEAMLAPALDRAAELDYLDKLAASGCERLVEPPPQAQRRMRAMLRNPSAFARRLRRPLYLRVLRTAAVIILTCALLLGAAMAVSPTVRAAVIDFVSSWFSDRTQYNVPDGTVGTGWTFGYIPDGFELVDSMETDIQINRVYINDKSQGFIIAISTGQEVIDNEHSDFYQTSINGRAADIYEATSEDQNNMIVMYDDSAGVTITLTSVIGVDELIKIAEGISR